MSEKKYFFRNNQYSIIEMIGRLDLEILAKDVMENKKTSKSRIIEEFLNNYKANSKLFDNLKKSFQMYGEKGDIVNIKLYDFAKYKYDLLNEEILAIIESLKGKELSSIGLLSSFVEKGKCYMEDIKIGMDYIDYKFKFEYETIIELEGNMVKELSYNNVEVRHYIKERLIAIIDTLTYEIKASVGMIYVMPYYAENILTGELKYLNPDYNQIKLNSTQLQSIKVLLGGNLRYAVLDMKSEKGVKVKVEGEEKDFEKNSQILKQNIQNGDNREVQFYWQDDEGKGNRITIKSDCQIISTRYLSEQALKKIIDCIIVVDTKQDMLAPINKITEKYCLDTFRKALARRITNSKIEKFTVELKELVTNINKTLKLKEFVPTNLYCTICLNILIQALKNTKDSPDDPEMSDFLKYELVSLLKWHLKYNYSISVTENELNASLRVLTKCVRIAGEKESKLLDTYYSL